MKLFPCLPGQRNLKTIIMVKTDNSVSEVMKMNFRTTGRFLLAGMLIMLGATILASFPAFAASDTLPVRSGPAPYTSKHVPHIQVGVEAVPEVSAALLRRVEDMPGVSIRDTIVSMAGALGFWLDESIPTAHPEVIVKGREFGHIHPDGSLHISLSPGLAARAVEAGWAIAHPWAKTRPGWEGFVMIYTPRTMAEMETVFQLVRGSYEFITGKDAPE
jgi:hypothetical protein